MEPIHPFLPAADLQLAACIQAWALEAASGHWVEPAPVVLQAELPTPEPEPSLVGSAWDSWSWGDHWLDDPQVEELPGCWDA